MTDDKGGRIRRVSRFALSALPLTTLFVASVSGVNAQTKPAPTPPRQAPRAPRPAPHPGSWEIGGGFWWSGGFDIGDATAELTRNPETGTGPLDLFSTSNTLASGIGLQGHLAGYVSKSIAIEGGVRITRPKLRIAITGDFENASDQVAEETITEYIFDGSLVWHLTHATFSKGKGVPFISGGVGYIRDAHEGNQLIETGTEYHATGGIKYWFNMKPRRLGLRAEGGVSFRDGGFAAEDKNRTVPMAGVSLTYLF
ncbi:MAG TPA: hypothetical protein VHI99_12645 [Vicinamibacterales bacterium]|nr:hypothetical protein [Vicinamibacterales bacterium]